MKYTCSLFRFQDAKECNKKQRKRLQKESDYYCVIQDINNGCHSDAHSIALKVNKYAEEREKRIDAFLTHLNRKRDLYFAELIKSKKCTAR